MSEYEDEFEKIKHLVETGTDINSLAAGASFLYTYLRSYYWWHITLNDVTYYDGMYDDLYDELTAQAEPFSVEKTLPLEQRDSLILEHLNWFFEQGADPNAGKTSSDRPLTVAVGNCDAFVTEYLLEHGADPNYDDSEGDTVLADGTRIPYGCGNWCIDELDVQALNASFDDPIDTAYFDAMLETCRVLLKYGAIADSDPLYCFSIDFVKQTASLHTARVMY